jgi:ketosteroid isomerase-like protein
MENNVERTVLDYYRIVGDLTRAEDELLGVIAPDATFVEHPNPIAPRGASRSAAESLAGFRAGRQLLRDQRIEVLEVMVQGDRAAVRATWSGVIGVDRGPFTAGAELSCVMAAWATVRDNRIVAHETYDCYPPLPV